MSTGHFCGKTICDKWHHHPCGKRACMFEEGKHWCKVHAPSSVAKRRAKSEAEWNAKAQARNAIFDREEAIEKASSAVIEAARMFRMADTIGNRDRMFAALDRLAAAKAPITAAKEPA